MSTTRPRRSTSTAVQYSQDEVAALRTAISELQLLVTKKEPASDQDTSQGYDKLVQTICQCLAEDSKPNKFQDAFRNLNGFQTILKLIHHAVVLAKHLSASQNGSTVSYGPIYHALKLLLAALQNHKGNRLYFQHRAEIGGWLAVQREVQDYFSCCKAAKWDIAKVYTKLSGQLLACSLEDDSFSDIFERLDEDGQAQGLLPLQEGVYSSESLESLVRSVVGNQNFVFSAGVFPIVLGLWSEQRSSEQSFNGAIQLLPNVLQYIASSRTHNLLAVHEAGLLTETISLLKDTSLPLPILKQLQLFSILLLNLGISKLEDAYMLYRGAITSRLIADTLRQALDGSDGSPYIHFDLSLHGFASVELPDLGHTFPPPSSASPGYTLSIWLQFVEFDTDSHTTVFGAFDSTQTCFVLVYLEKDTRNIILQTSVTSSRPSVRFRSYDFEVGKWYHVCIVHRRPGMTSSSRASLFVNGEFIEQAKAHFPSPPPLASTLGQENGDIASPGRKHGAVQCFLGTPQDLAPNLGRGVSSSQWRVGSACLLNDALSDDLIAVHRELGPRYYGNFQDCLGSFQTYEASASLNLRNETLHPGKEEKSIVVAAIRSKAGNLLPESKFLLNVSPETVLGCNLDRPGPNEARVAETLSKHAVKNLRHWTRGGRHAVVVNGAVPSINKALLHAYGTCFLTGQPAVLSPQALDDATWRLGGSAPIGLAILEAADSDEEIKRALDILFTSIQGSWRNSEAMERENGFSILAALLSSKLARVNETRNMRVPSLDEMIVEEDSLMLDILTRILSFVGYKPECPENSVINNPLAYRILLVDLDVWRSAPPKVQRLYYEQFTVFSIGSKHHLFNARRLARMRKRQQLSHHTFYILNVVGITKKWLGALKGDVFYPETLEYFLTAFRSLLENTMTAETHRSIALHITYSVYQSKDKTNGLRHMKSNAKQTPPPFGPMIRRSTAPVSSAGRETSDFASSRGLTRSQVGVKMLELYADMLCQHGSTTNIKKFARTVTNKVRLPERSSTNCELTRSVASLLASRGRTCCRNPSFEDSCTCIDRKRSAVR